MSMPLFFDFNVDKTTNTITIKREFAADRAIVWDCYTKSEILDQWWMPQPFKSKTKSMDFREGGKWHYAAVGPNGEEHWAITTYVKIETQKMFLADDAFGDADGNINPQLPQSKWTMNFTDMGENTLVHGIMQFPDLAQLEQTIAMGFKDGLLMAMENLDLYIEMQFKLRQQNKTNNKSRVTTYLNFPGNTEEAFLFYKTVFKTEFIGKGLQRFGDIPAEAGQPTMADNIKKMILHVELPITANHILMATDAPEEMGFTLTQGNNMHISIEPETREEAKRIFDELSNGGKITMPLEDMFFGSYFGSFSDKFGINWMINFQNKQ